MTTRQSVAIVLTAGALLAGIVSVAESQVVFDDTFGTGGDAPTRLLDGSTDYLIEPNRGRLVSGGGRSNLFHSFGQFDIPMDESATFLLTDSIDTLIARVTGGTRSVINGQLRGELTCPAPPCNGVARADVFFINPAGVLFGESASLELPGSFYVTSADSLRFTDDIRFSSADPAPTVTAAAPEAFGFLAGPSGDIVVDSPRSLRVEPGSTLSATGGNVEVRGGTVLLATGGNIELGAVGSAAAEVPIALEGWTTRAGDAATLGEVRIEDGVAIDATDLANLNQDQGRIVIRGGRFSVELSNLFASGDGSGESAIDIEVAGELASRDASLFAFGAGTQETGGIRLAGSRVEVLGAGFDSVIVQTAGAGGAGSIVVDADQLVVDEGGRITSETFGSGEGASIDITADSVEVGADSAIRTRTFADGFAGNNGGDIRIEVADLSIRDGGRILATTVGSGIGGDILVVGADRVRVEGGDAGGIPSGIVANSGTQVDSDGTGGGGLISIETTQLELLSGAQIRATTENAGNAGNIQILEADSVRVEGELGDIPSGIFSTSGIPFGVPATGNGGLIRIETQDLSMRSGGQISARTFGAGGAGQIEIDATGRVLIEGAGAGSGEPTLISTRGRTGDGGRLEIQADVLELRNGGRLVSSTNGPGDAGEIRIAARDVRLLGRSPQNVASQIRSSTTFSDGTAGRIDIDATENIALRDGASINALSSGAGNTNDITLDAGGTIALDSDAEVTSEASSTLANVIAGNVLLTAGNRIAIRGGSRISAEAAGLGDAGNIEMRAPAIELTDASLTTNAATALGGNILIESLGNVDFFQSQATTDVGAGMGQGGDIVINAETSTLNASRVTANARGSADAGNVRITTIEGLIESTNNVVSASAELGINGSVVVQGPNSEAAGELSQLPAAFLDAASQLQEACLARDAPAGSFAVQTVRDPTIQWNGLFEPFDDEIENGVDACEATLP